MDRYIIRNNMTGEVTEQACYMIPKLYSCDYFTERNILRRDYESYINIVKGEERESYIYDWNSPFRNIYDTEQEYYKAMVKWATFTSKDGVKPCKEVIEIKSDIDSIENSITLQVLHDDDILYETYTPLTKEDMLDLKDTFRKGKQYGKSFEVIVNNLDKIADKLFLNTDDVKCIILDNALADDEFYLYDTHNKGIGHIEVVTSKQAKENDMDFIVGTELKEEYKLFDPDTSNYSPLTDDKTWAFREM